MARRVQTAVAVRVQQAVLRERVLRRVLRAVRELVEPMARRVQTAVAEQVLPRAVVVLREPPQVAVLRVRRVKTELAVQTAVRALAV